MNYLPSILILGILVAVALPAYNDYRARASALAERVATCEVRAAGRAQQAAARAAARTEPRRDPVLCGGAGFQVASLVAKAVRPLMSLPPVKAPTVLVAQTPAPDRKASRTAARAFPRQPDHPSS